MNNTFNISRLGLLLRRQWQEFGKIFLISLVVLAGVLSTFYVFNIPDLERYSANDMNMSFRYPLFLIVGFLFISLLASAYFSSMGQKPRAIIELMIPCSTLEKFVAGVLFTSILAVLSFLIVFQLIDLAFTSYLNSVFMGKTAVNWEKVVIPIHFNLFSDTLNDGANRSVLFRAMALIPLAVTALFLLGSIYFTRFHYLKTAVTIIVFVFAVVYSLIKIQDWLIAGKTMVYRGNDSEGEPNPVIWVNLICLVVACIFWYIGYRRLKEKEV